MNQAIFWTALVATGLGASGGYWLAWRQTGNNAPATIQTEKQPLYYRHPMNPAITSPVPAQDDMGMDYLPVYRESAPPAETGTHQENGLANREPKILYYRNPMGLPDTSPVPKKDSMGMEYIPVYADEETQGEANVLQVSTEKIQRLGVRTASVEHTVIARTVRGVGTVEADERRLYGVTLRFDGFIEKLHVNATGQSVARGQPLFELYSPDLVSAQREYLSARKAQSALANSESWMASGMKDLADGSLERLRNWGISEPELENLEKQGQVRHALTVRSPASGIVLEKSAVAGARAMAGDTLFRIADLSKVWIIAEVYEQDIGLIEPGGMVRAELDAYPGQSFQGQVGFVYPTVNPATRTARVRIELPNPRGLFKPMMYAHLEIDTQARRALAVPRSAVLESGRRTLVLVERGEGRFEPRPVKPGIRGEETIEILEGLREHERVVVGANFLIDAESNLKAAVGSFGSTGSGTEGSTSTEPPPSSAGHAGRSGHGGM